MIQKTDDMAFLLTSVIVFGLSLSLANLHFLTQRQATSPPPYSSPHDLNLAPTPNRLIDSPKQLFMQIAVIVSLKLFFTSANSLNLSSIAI